MIRFTYIPLGGSGLTAVELLDDDRYWPATIGHDSSGVLQVVGDPRAASQRVLARANVIVPIRFSTMRFFASLALAYDHAFKQVPKANGQVGTLDLLIPGGGAIHSVGCGCESSPADVIGVSVRINWRFTGPLPT